MKVFNRYGKQVFETNDPDIDWDGYIGNKLASSGVYYYICDVHIPLITGIQVKTLTGFIHIYSGDSNTIAE